MNYKKLYLIFIILFSILCFMNAIVAFFVDNYPAMLGWSVATIYVSRSYEISR